MNLTHLKDQQLLSQTKELVKRERDLLTQILHHLREVESRKLFSELGYKSLFEYAVEELQYSEGQAGRRIQALRLINEVPEVEEKISTGKLSLSNISQAQSYFRESKKQRPHKPVSSEEKIKVLEQLENKSAREGQKILLGLHPERPLPKERQRAITESHTEVRFVMDSNLEDQISEVRALLGPKATHMTLADLIAHMASLSIRSLKEKKFGKKRVRENLTQPNLADKNANTTPHSVKKSSSPSSSYSTPTSEFKKENPRYLTKRIKYQVWLRDQGSCTRCGSQQNLHFDHIQPVACGGPATLNNLRLLCFHCNQQQALKTFGMPPVKKCSRK